MAQPGGIIMKIKCNPDDCFFDETSDTNKEVTANYVDYQTIQSPQIRSPNISTEVLGDLDIFIEGSKTEEGNNLYKFIDFYFYLLIFS